MENNSYDAIVVGTGISGSWAAKELTEHGLKTLVLDRGRMIRHGDYPTALLNPWELPYGGRPTHEDLLRQPVAARTGYGGGQARCSQTTASSAASRPSACRWARVSRTVTSWGAGPAVSRAS